MTQNKYLEKAAFNASSFFKELKAIKTLYPSTLKGGAIGAGAGAAAGGFSSEKIDWGTGDFVKKTTGERVLSALAGAALFGSIGASLGSERDLIRNAAELTKKYGGSGGGFRSYFEDSISSMEKDLGFPKVGFKTKAEATAHFRRTAMKNHPDRGGKIEDIQKINAAWEKYKNHPEGFDKLARLI